MRSIRHRERGLVRGRRRWGTRDGAANGVWIDLRVDFCFVGLVEVLIALLLGLLSLYLRWSHGLLLHRLVAIVLGLRAGCSGGSECGGVNGLLLLLAATHAAEDYKAGNCENDDEGSGGDASNQANSNVEAGGFGTCCGGRGSGRRIGESRCGS